MGTEKPTPPVTDLILRDVDTQETIRLAINNIVGACHELANEAGWWTDLETGEDVRTWPAKHLTNWVLAKVALMHSELSEGVEGYRKNLKDDKLPERDMFEVELADVVIRIFDLAGGLRLDLGGAMAEKLIYNAGREDHKLENRKSTNGKRV